MSCKEIAKALIDTQGQLFSDEVGANIARDVPQQWFHWLLTAQLCSARISGRKALQASAALRETGFHKIDAILDAGRGRLIRVLNENGYARFDNVGADQIRAAAELVRETYDDDLRNLNERAGGDPARVRKLLQEVKGIGSTGADIFCREAQMVWTGLGPTADRLCLDQAGKLGLPEDAEKLEELAGERGRFVRLLAGLARAALDGESDAVAQAART
ncbi:hypothetical protein [Pseudooceanicola batsensis]|nr:hypothetical protein [Pseudooceanicola batsensis]